MGAQRNAYRTARSLWILLLMAAGWLPENRGANASLCFVHQITTTRALYFTHHTDIGWYNQVVFTQAD